MACPSRLTPGYNFNPVGFPIDYLGDTYWYDESWRTSAWGTGASEADYVPGSRANPLEGARIDGAGGVLYWYDAGHRQRCSKRVTRDRFGRIKSVATRLLLLDTYGYQTPGGGSGGGGEDDDGPATPTIGGNEACTELRLDPGCYDLWVDGTYSGAVCC
jgi:hypothetical protein